MMKNSTSSIGLGIFHTALLKKVTQVQQLLGEVLTEISTDQKQGEKIGIRKPSYLIGQD